uniref:Uncharacterized protein n=1 Tax=Glossina brevipalpis TaxID=37001 RepID=A0A1A9WXE5_9MUSC
MTKNCCEIMERLSKGFISQYEFETSKKKYDIELNKGKVNRETIYEYATCLVRSERRDDIPKHERIEDALATYKKVIAKEPNFILDYYKTVSVTELLLKEDRFEDALNFLEKNKKTRPQDEIDTSYIYSSRLSRMLNALAESGNVHLVRDDIPNAMQTFGKICEQYKATPWKNELARRLIQAKDANNLQKLINLSTNIHGEINSLHDLVFIFVEYGRIRMARKILETPGLRTRPHRIDTAGKRNKNESMVESLLKLLKTLIISRTISI